MAMDEFFQKILDDIQSSKKAVTILPGEGSAREKIRDFKINLASLLGRLLDNTGGIIIDNWIRFYGTGAIDFSSRNKLFPFDDLVIAEDVLGGFFICLENGHIGYFAPDCLCLEDLEIQLNQFLYWCLHGDTDTFYMDYRWENWREDLADLGCDEGVAFYPFLWATAGTRQGQTPVGRAEKSMESRERRIVPMAEIIGLELHFYEQMQGKNPI